MSYLPHTPEEREAMLEAIGVSTVDDLFSNVPEPLRSGPLQIPEGMSEMEVLRLLNTLASENVSLSTRPAFLGGGAYHHYIPSAVGAITGRSEFYTAYTPYQAEVSQGTLQAMYEYQTMVAELTGLDISNASLYDAATAITEACTIAINETGRDRIVVMGGLNPEYRRVLETYMHAQGFEITDAPEEWVAEPGHLHAVLDDTVAGVIAQSPNFWGALEPMAQLTEAAHHHGALMIAVGNPLSMAILSPPGEYAADIAVGCGQPFGIPLSYGGPYLGIIAARSGLERRLPGRIAGETVDNDGNRGFVLTLQAREQHIRRERATSNICTNHQLMALAATVHLALLGKEGIRDLAGQCVQRAHYAARRLCEISGFSLAFDAPYFNEFVLRTPVPAAEVNRFLLGRGIVGGIDLGMLSEDMRDCLLLAFTEMNSREQIDDLVTTLGELQPQTAAEFVAGATGGVS